MSFMMDGDQPPDEFGEEVEFTIVEDRGPQATLECPACAFVFDVDAHTEENLQWNKKQRALLAVCPICQRRQK